MNSDQPAPDELSDEQRQQVEEICDIFLRQLKAGKRPDSQAIAEEYPSLAAKLGSRLKLLEAVFRATNPSSGFQDSRKASEVPELPDSLDDSFEIDSANIDGHTSENFVRTSRDFLFHETARRINCPHCGNLVQLVNVEKKEVTCDSCGSAVSIAGETTRIDSDAKIPREIGRFIVKRVLGQGAFGSVYLAFDPQLRREVALKVPRQGYFITDNEEQRFFREAQSAAKLNHANIVRVHEVSKNLETPFIVSEYIEGMTLGDLASGGLLTFNEIVEFVAQICSAVEHAHQNGIIHRDLKPSNILIDQYRNAFVCDFGLARREDTEITMTVDGMVLGTPAYMSPEQAAGIHQKVNATSDVYSLGVVLYKLLARELPFSGTKRMLLHQVIHDEPKSPRRLNDNIPKDLETITLKAMGKKQSERFQSAGEMQLELERWLRGEPIYSRPVSSLTRFWKLCKRHPLTASLCSIIAGLLLLGSVYAWLTAKNEALLRGVADQNAIEAVHSQRESEQRLNNLYLQKGYETLDSNELVESGYWFSKSLEVADTPTGRLRLEMILDRLPTLQALLPVESRTRDLKFSSNGLRVAVGTSEGSAKVFDSTTGELLFQHDNPGKFPVFHVEFLSNDENLAFRSAKSSIQIWDIANNRLIKEINHPNVVNAMAVDSAGSLLATAGEDKRINIWNGKDGELQKELKFEQELDAIRFATGSARLLIQTVDSDSESGEIASKLELVEIASGESIWQKALAYPLTTDVKREHLLTTSPSEMSLWNLETGKQIGESVNSEGIASGMIDDQENQIVSISDSGRIQTWNIASAPTRVAEFQLKFDIGTIVSDATSRTFAASDQDGSIRTYSTEAGVELVSRIPTRLAFPTMKFAPDGYIIAIESKGEVQIWDCSSSVPSYLEFNHDDQVKKAMFSNNGKRCYTIGLDGKAYIWDTESGQQIGSTIEHAAGIVECDLTSDDQLFATASFDKTVSVWDAATGARIGNSLPHESPVLEVVFASDGKHLASGCDDGTVSVWKISTDRTKQPSPIATMKHEDRVRKLVFGPDNLRVFSASMDGTVRGWDSKSGIAQSGPFNHGKRSLSLDLSLDGKQIVSGGSNGSIKVWNLDGSILKEFELEGDPWEVKYSSPNLVVASQSFGTTSVFQTLENGMELLHELKHPFLPAVFYSDVEVNSQFVVSGGGWPKGKGFHKGGCLIWSLADGSIVGPPLQHEAYVAYVEFSPEGNKLISASSDGNARLWNFEETKLSTNNLVKLFDFLRHSATEIELQDSAEDLSQTRISVFQEVQKIQNSRLVNKKHDRLTWEKQLGRLHKTYNQ